MSNKKTNLEKQAEKILKNENTDDYENVELSDEQRKSILDDTFTDMDEETQSEGENLTEILKAWLDDAYIHAKTRLNQNQIIALTILKTLSEKYNVKCIKELIDNFVRYKLSEGGQSSKELVEILKSRTDVEIDDSLAKAVEPFMK